jgi:hypothetical protein
MNNDDTDYLFLAMALFALLVVVVMIYLLMLSGMD